MSSENAGKLYYSISEVAQMTNLEPYVLRFWEKEFSQLRPKKNRSGNRTYQTKDIEIVKTIKKLLYTDGYTIDGARNVMRKGQTTNSKDGLNEQQLRNLLLEIKRDLTDLLKLFS